MKKLIFLFLPMFLLLPGSCNEDDKMYPEIIDEYAITFSIDIASGIVTELTYAAEDAFWVDWGDGNVEMLNKTEKDDGAITYTHQYKHAGIYEIKLQSNYISFLSLDYADLHAQITSEGINFGNCLLLEEVRIWRQQGIERLDFSNCPKITNVSIDDCTNLHTLIFQEDAPLKFLTCIKTAIRNLDLSHLPTLHYLYCPDNHLQTIDLSNNKNLIQLHCHNNKLAELNLKGLSALLTLNCTNNRLTGFLNLRDATELTTLDCSYNQINLLDEMNLTPKLTSLMIEGNRLEKFSPSPLVNLTVLNCSYNAIGFIDFSGNKQISGVNIANNQITSCIFPEQNQLTVLFCGNNNMQAEALNAIIESLPNPLSTYSTGGTSPERYIFQMKGNPGEHTCNWQEINKKGWRLLDQDYGNNIY